MTKEKQIEKLAEDIYLNCQACLLEDEAEMIAKFVVDEQGYRKQSENETLEAVDMFRNLIMNKFIELCNYNDYGKINLLLIGETIDRIFDDVVAKMKGGEE